MTTFTTVIIHVVLCAATSDVLERRARKKAHCLYSHMDSFLLFIIIIVIIIIVIIIIIIIITCFSATKKRKHFLKCAQCDASLRSTSSA